MALLAPTAHLGWVDLFKMLGDVHHPFCNIALVQILAPGEVSEKGKVRAGLSCRGCKAGLHLHAQMPQNSGFDCRCDTKESHTKVSCENVLLICALCEQLSYKVARTAYGSQITTSRLQ